MVHLPLMVSAIIADRLDLYLLRLIGCPANGSFDLFRAISLRPALKWRTRLREIAEADRESDNCYRPKGRLAM